MPDRGATIWVGDGTYDLYVYHNTFVSMESVAYGPGVQAFNSSSSDIYAENNLWYDTEGITFRNCDHDYNAATVNLSENNGVIYSEDPFNNLSSDDFSLNRQLGEGNDTLGAPYDWDMLGYERGLDSVWDFGAIELYYQTPVPVRPFSLLGLPRPIQEAGSPVPLRR